MKTLSIVWKDIAVLFKDRGQVFQLLLLPLLFVLVFTGALGELTSEGEEDTRLPLTVVNLDGGQAAASLLAGLDEAGGVKVELTDQAEAMAALDENEIKRLLLVPAGFTAAVEGGGPTTLRLINRTDASAKETEAVRLVVEGVARDMSLEIQLLAALRQMGQMQADNPEAAEAFDLPRTQAQARSQFEAAQDTPLVSVRQRLPGVDSAGGWEADVELADVAVPGLTVLFVFFTAQVTARSIFEEKKVGTFRRLQAAPLSKAALLAGKLLPNFGLSLLQIGVIFVFGIYVLPLIGLQPATLGPHPVATIVVLLLLALCSSAFGITIAALARTEGQITGLSLLTMWGMGIVGGSLVPTFLLERFLGPLPKIVPHYWGNHALLNLTVRGLGFADVALDMGVLLAFAVIFFAIGLWRFDFE